MEFCIPSGRHTRNSVETNFGSLKTLKDFMSHFFLNLNLSHILFTRKKRGKWRFSTLPASAFYMRNLTGIKSSKCIVLLSLFSIPPFDLNPCFWWSKETSKISRNHNLVWSISKYFTQLRVRRLRLMYRD